VSLCLGGELLSRFFGSGRARGAETRSPKLE
jgi:hypothetical protein